ncbi:unnamed protein product [Adineta steineri]|uniref:Uncharacterized protein n=1 Tax=Adineta steineri TaxID=433720 RepID=A0A813MXB1_9BILA|nr:unnamed protein product [Adineta steineri]
MLVNNGEVHYRETDPLQIDIIYRKIPGTIDDFSVESELQRHVKNAIKTLKLKFTDNSDELAHYGFLELKNRKDNIQNIEDVDENDRFPFFIHLATNTKSLSISRYIEVYQLPAPDFILSIQTSSVYDNNDSHKQKSGIQTETERAVQNGLTAMAKITRPWITTSCINDDMMKLLGDALHRDVCGRDIPCLGICNWNYASGDELLVKNFSKASINDEIRSMMGDDYSTVHTYVMMPNLDCNNIVSHRRLQPNHTHFILLNDESKDMKNMLSKRQEIEHELSINRILKSPIANYPPKNIVSDHDIPIIMLLIAGDFSTLATICKGLAAATPIVVIRNTGGIADIIAQLCRKLSPTDELGKFRKRTYVEECKNQLKALCLDKDDIIDPDEEIEKYMNIFNEMEELVIIFDAIDHTNLEDAIADAMLRGIKYRAENWEHFFSLDVRDTSLIWCMIWNKSDYAKKLLVDRNDDNTTSTDNHKQKKNHMMIPLMQQLLFEALCRNNVSFVSLLMEYGASIEELTEEQLIIICVKTLNDDALILNNSEINLSLFRYENKIRELKTFVEKKYNDYLLQYLEHYVVKDRMKEYLLHEHRTNRDFLSLSKNFDGRKTEALYLWFVFMNQPALAKYLCSRSRNQLVASLLAVEIYTSARKGVRKNKQILANIAQEFDQHSRNIIDKCLVTDSDFALKLLECKAPAFYSCVPLDIVQRTNCQIFLASDTIQMHLLNMWYHRFNHRQRLLNIPAAVWVLTDSDFALKLLECKAPAFYSCVPLDIVQRTNCQIFLASDTIQMHLLNMWYHRFNHRQRLLNIPAAVWIITTTVLFPVLPIVPILFPSLFKNTSSKSESTSNSPNPYHAVVAYKPPSPKESVPNRCSIGNIFKRIKWYYEAPMIRFYSNLMFFIVFLLLFSYVLLVSYFPINAYIEHRSKYEIFSLPLAEFLLHICMWSLIIDELYQFASQITMHYSYSTNSWNWMDQAGILIYLMAFFSRWSYQQTWFIWSKIFMSVACVIWYIRILFFFAASQRLGPKLTMIYEMTKDAMMIFVCFILVILFGFSVSSWALLTTKSQIIWPNQSNDSLWTIPIVTADSYELWNWDLLRDVFNWGIWKVFGQVAEPYNDAVSENDNNGAFVFLFSIAFTVISNVLLLNVLIAMFNEKITRVQETSKELWRNQRFWLIYEMKDKTVLPPPFNILCYIGQFLIYICHRCKKLFTLRRDRDTDDESKLSLVVISDTDPDQRTSYLSFPRHDNSLLNLIDNQVTSREKAIAESYWQEVFQKEKQEASSNKLYEDTEKLTQNYDQQQPLHEILHTQKILELTKNKISDKGAQQLADVIPKNTTLIKIDLSKNRITKQGAQYLSDALLNNRTITELDLSSNHIDALGAQYISKVCRNNKALNNINLASNQIGDNGAQHLAYVIPQNTTLKILNLENNQIGNYGAECLANALQDDMTLIHLDLGANHIGAQGLRHLALALANNTTLNVLNLTSNKIENNGVQYLASILSNNTTLATLNLGSNRIGPQGIQYLADALEKGAVLSTLTISNNQIGHDGIVHLANVLKNNQTITTLDVGSNGIGDEGIQYLIDSLNKNTTLTKLNISSNQISATTAKKLAQTIGYNTTLTQLDLSYNQLGPDGIQYLAPILRLNTTLTTLSLSSNRIGNTGAQYLAYALQSNKSITTLDLSRNQIGNTGISYLSVALYNNTTLHTLDLSNNQIGDAGVKSLTEAFGTNSALNNINLRFNKIRDGGAHSLAVALVYNMNVAVKQLELGHNQISDQGAHKLADFLQYNATLVKLEMTGNPITIDAARYLSQTLRNKLSLTTHNLAVNEIGGEWIQYLSDTLHNDKTFVTLDLENKEIGYKDIRLLSVALRNNTTVTAINLNGNHLDVMGIEYLSKTLRDKPMLTKLELDSNEIRTEGMSYLTDIFDSNTLLVELNLNNNDIGDQGLQHLAQALRDSKTLKILRLTYNKIEERGIQYLANAFQNVTTLTTLDLGFNKLGDSGLGYLIDVLQRNTNLTTLHLSRVNCRFKGVQHIADYLRNNTTLTELDFSRNRIGIDGNEPIEYLTDALCTNRTLTTLKLATNKFGSDGTEYFAKMLENNITLTELDLSYNWVGDNGLEHIASFLKNNQTLTSLALIQNEIEDLGISHLAAALEDNHALTTLLLNSNYIGNAGCEYLANALKNNNTLTNLGLYGNFIEDEGAQYLADAFRENTTLITLNLKKNSIEPEKMQYLTETFQNNMRVTPIKLEDKEYSDQDDQLQIDSSLSKTALMTFALQDEDKGVERAQYLADIFTNNQTLNTLDLENDNIGTRGMENVANAFQNNTTLMTLNLAANDIGDEGIQYLIKILENNNTLTKLNLQYNKITSEGAEHLAKVLANNTTLKSLDLSENEIGISGTQHLAEILKNNNTLTELDLTKNEIDNEGITHLGKALESNKTLTTVKLGDNGITAEGIEHFINFLRNNTTLTTLNLNINLLSTDGVKHLATAFQNNNTLTTLELSRNQIDNEAMEYLAEILRNTQALTTLILSRNTIGDKGITYLANVLRNNMTLTKLDLNHNEIEDQGIEELSTALLNNTVNIHV